MLGDILKSSFITVLTCINLIANSGMIAILVKSRKIQEDSSTPLLLALNVSDLVHAATFGMVGLILSWTGATDATIPHAVKQFHFFSMRFTRMGSLNLVAALGIVKLVTIVKPLRAVQLITKTRVYLMLSACFMVTFPACLLGAFSTLKYSFAMKETYAHPMRIIISSLSSISLILYSFCYLYIFLSVVRQIIIMRRLVLPAEGTIQPNPVITALKSTKGIMAVLTVYVIIYIPVLFFPKFYSESGGNMMFVFYWLSYSLGFLNVCSYIAFSKPARKELKKFLSYVQVRNET